MMRNRGLLLVLCLTPALSLAQGLSSYPMYEDQLAGVKLGWHARTMTGIWNFDGIAPAQRQRLAKIYNMPDHIILRLGTKMPLAEGTGAGPDGSFVFMLGTYGRGAQAASAGGGGGGEGGPGSEGGAPPPGAQAQGPTDQQVDDKVERWLAEAQMGMPPSQIAGPATGATPPDLSGMGGEGTGGPGGGGQQGGGGQRVQLPDITAAAGRYAEIQPLYYAERPVIAEEAADLVQRFQQKYEELVESMGENDSAKTAAITNELARLRGMMDGIRDILGMPDLYHVFHVGFPQRDIVFSYETAPSTWTSITVNFYTWQVNGITVAGNQPWAGARTSSLPGIRGVQLGDSLQHIFNRYGWPDGWESFLGRYLLIHYYDRNNVGFMLDHPAPKVWRVIRIVIEPRPNAQERQLAGVQLGLDAQQLLKIRDANGKLVYGAPHAIERPNHRVSVIGQTPEPRNRPPGILLDRRLALLGGGGGGGGAGGEGGGPGGPEGGAGGPEGAPPAAAMARGTLPTSAADANGRPVAQAQGPEDAGGGMPGEAGSEGGGAAAAVPAAGVLYPVPFYYDNSDGFNNEEACNAPPAAAGGAGEGAGEGGGAQPAGDTGSEGGDAGGAGAGGGASGGDRAALAAVLGQIYDDPQAGFNLAFGGRTSPGDCRVNALLPESTFRWDYRFDPDVRCEFGLDSDGLCTQIGVMGTQWGGARSKRGIGLGSQLLTVLYKYGPPLLYQEFTSGVVELQPDISILSYARDERGRAYGNINFALQDNRVTAMQIVALTTP